MLDDDLTLFDHALTRPWTVNKTSRAATRPSIPVWLEENCPEAQTRLIQIGSEIYSQGRRRQAPATRKDQPPPDLKYFDQTRR